MQNKNNNHNNNTPSDGLIEVKGLSSSPSIIKVIGVGGGGGNAVNHMYREGIHDVNFILCNTDSKALADSPVPSTLQLGKEGLGAGNRPARARAAAEESIDEIDNMLSDGTKMVFITAGMGGGTGTGAAPVIAKRAKDKGILTVGIVTIPFLFEGYKKIDQALDGVEEIAKHVDALLVINNERLREIYPDLNVLSAFERADSTLSIAARSIAEIITMHGIINLDFQDVCTVLRDGGVAIMSTGYGEGEGRVTHAIEDALNSPLLNNNDIFNSKKVLIFISFAAESEKDTLMMEEMNEIHEFMSKFHDDVETKWGLAIDPTLEKKIKITILATGFGINAVEGMQFKKELEEEEDERRRQERLDEYMERREKYYKPTDARKQRNRARTFLFALNDLNNEEIISLVELTPTSKRTKEQLNDIKQKSREAERMATEENASKSETPTVITF